MSANKEYGFMAPLRITEMNDRIRVFPREAIKCLVANYGLDEVIKGAKEESERMKVAVNDGE